MGEQGDLILYMQPTEEIKSKLDIVELVSEYLQLKPAGSGSFKANCPFHQEKTPSFFVSRSKQIWHCFGCGEGGDHFAFIQKIEGMDFPEALKFLADKAGVRLPEYNKEKSGLRQRLVEINDLAAKFYHRVLLESQSAEPARKYLEKRNLDTKTIDRFILGYSPNDWEVLLNFLKKKGYKENEISQAGLIIRSEKGSGFYDRFRGRIMFPIQNLQGKVVGFTARLLDPEAKEAKYVNTPQTLIYNKSEILYGLDKAKRAIQEADLAVVVEGNMDVIASHRVGVANVIASSGTALTEAQINIIKRYSQNIAFSFDADSAGQVAAKRGIDMALAGGMNVGVIILEGAKDPDELINKDAELWKKAIDRRVVVMDYYFGIVKKDYDLNTAEGKKNASKFLLDEISKISDRVEQSHWIQELAKLLNVSEQVLRESMPGQKVKSLKEKSVEKEPAPKKLNQEEQAWSRLISILINRPELIDAIEKSYHPEYIADESYQQLYKKLILFYNSARLAETGDKANIYQKLEEFINKEVAETEIKDRFYVLALAGERDWQEADQETLKKELLKICQFSESLYKSRKKQELAKAMREAEEKGDQEKVKDILQQYRQFE